MKSFFSRSKILLSNIFTIFAVMAILVSAPLSHAVVIAEDAAPEVNEVPPQVQDPAPQFGYVTVCTIVIDADGNVSRGDAGASLSVPFADGTFHFSTPLSFNKDIFADVGEGGGFDAQCDTDDRDFGTYSYGQEVIASDQSWQAPLYNDDFDLQGFYTTSDLEHFLSTVHEYGTDSTSSGSITLSSDHADRTILVVNRMKPKEVPVDVPVTPPDQSGGGSTEQSGGTDTSSGGGGASSVTIDAPSRNFGHPSVVSAPQGRVLGESTCGEYITDYIKYGAHNDPANVTRLQQFLNSYLGLHLTVDGKFGKSTLQAVKQFQLKEKDQILSPWVGVTLKNSQQATGWVFKTTKNRINEIKCPTLNVSAPSLTVNN